MASHWIEAGVIVAMFVALPSMIRASKKSLRGRLGGAAMMVGLAFAVMFDPAKARSAEIIRKKHETPEAEANGAPPEAGTAGDAT